MAEAVNSKSMMFVERSIGSGSSGGDSGSSADSFADGPGAASGPNTGSSRKRSASATHQASGAASQAKPRTRRAASHSRTAVSGSRSRGSSVSADEALSRAMAEERRLRTVFSNLDRVIEDAVDDGRVVSTDVVAAPSPEGTTDRVLADLDSMVGASESCSVSVSLESSVSDVLGLITSDPAATLSGGLETSALGTTDRILQALDDLVLDDDSDDSLV